MRPRLPLPPTLLGVAGLLLRLEFRRLLVRHLDPLSRLRIDPIRASVHPSQHLLEDPSEWQARERRNWLFAVVPAGILDPPLLLLVRPLTTRPGHPAGHAHDERKANEEDE